MKKAFKKSGNNNTTVNNLKKIPLLVTNLQNVRYLTKFKCTSGWCLLTKQGKKYFITDNRYKEAAHKFIKGFIIKIFKESGATKLLNKLLDKEKISTICIENDSITVKEFEKFKKSLPNKNIIPAPSEITAKRIYKTSTEVNNIKKAINIAQNGFRETIKIIKKGISEHDIALEYEYIVKKSGAEGIPFDTIVAFGKNSSQPHHFTSNRKLSANEPILVDFGAIYDGYSCDLTRMVFYGKIGKCFRRTFNVLIDTIKHVEKKSASLMNAGQYDKTARDYLRKYNLEKYFIHSLGHGFGLDIHEEPHLSSSRNEEIKNGMVFTIEPGVYIPNKFGIRIENNYHYKDRLIKLTSLSEKVVEI